MAEENKMPTREECLACVKENRGKAAKKIAELAGVCKQEKAACLLAQQELAGFEMNNPEIGNNSEIE